MNLRETLKPVFAYEYWVPQVVNSMVQWNKIRDDKGAIRMGANGTIYLYADAAMRPSGVVRNLRDSAGTNIFSVDGQEYQMYVTALTPQLDEYGVLRGYQHTLKNKITPVSIQALRAAVG